MSKKKKKKSKKGSVKGIGFLGNATSIAKHKAVDEVGKPLLIMGGLFASRLVNWGLDKVITENPEDGKIVSILKKAAKPTANIVIGTGLVWLGVKKQKSVVKHIGYGFVLGGGVDASVVIFKKNLFGMNGLGAADEKVYKDQVADLQRLVAQNSFEPNLLPTGNEKAPSTEEVSGVPFTSALVADGNHMDNPL